MDTPKERFAAVPPMNLSAIRDALKAHGVTLNDVVYEVDCRCDVCGATWSEEASLDDPLSEGWWQCYKCDLRAEEGQRYDEGAPTEQSQTDTFPCYPE